jgi:hypothetical protein
MYIMNNETDKINIMKYEYNAHYTSSIIIERYIMYVTNYF